MEQYQNNLEQYQNNLNNKDIELNNIETKENINKTETFNDMVQNFITKYETVIKVSLIIFSVFFMIWVYNTFQPKHYNIIQSGGNNDLVAAAMKSGDAGATAGKGPDVKPPKGISRRSKMMSKYSKGLSKFKGGLKGVGSKPLISSGFTYFFQFLNALFMIIGIILILVLIPLVPILIFLTISYFIARRKLWTIRTL